MKGICQARFEAFGAAGKASLIKPLNLDEMHSVTPQAA
jgi:fructose-bisphosphate aldolase (EC 4.1.2.13)